jgi:hypothetical protein
MVMPRALQAARFTLSLPAPQMEIGCSVGPPTSTRSVDRAWARMLTTNRGRRCAQSGWLPGFPARGHRVVVVVHELEQVQVVVLANNPRCTLGEQAHADGLGQDGHAAADGADADEARGAALELGDDSVSSEINASRPRADRAGKSTATRRRTR